MSETFPEMGLGWYRLRHALYVRTDAGLNWPKTDHIFDGCMPEGMLPAGSVIQILEIKYLSVSVWGRCTEGWICMYMSRTAYVQRVA